MSYINDDLVMLAAKEIELQHKDVPFIEVAECIDRDSAIQAIHRMVDIIDVYGYVSVATVRQLFRKGDSDFWTMNNSTTSIPESDYFDYCWVKGSQYKLAIKNGHAYGQNGEQISRSAKIVIVYFSMPGRICNNGCEIETGCLGGFVNGNR